MSRKDPCSKKQVERYLLNQMTLEEETLFQNHLMRCEFCTTYLSEIRMIASIVGNEELTFCFPQKKRKMMRIWMRGWVVAACLILLVGISTFWIKRNQSKGQIYSTYIEYNNRASADEVGINLLFPIKDTIYQKRNQPILFRWNRSSPFHLRISYERIDLLEIDGDGADCTLSPMRFISYPSITWSLVIDKHSYVGQIAFLNN